MAVQEKEFEGFERKHLRNLALKEKVLVWGNVLRVFESERITSLLIDDFSGTASVNAFPEQKHLLKGISKGDRIQAFGEVKLDKNEGFYISPEIVIKIDCETELLRRLENLKFLKNSQKPQPAKESSKLEVERKIL